MGKGSVHRRQLVLSAPVEFACVCNGLSWTCNGLRLSAPVAVNCACNGLGADVESKRRGENIPSAGQRV